jgi:hypothetical protein
MKSYLSYFNDQSRIDAADLAAALAGVSNGRNQRFLNVHDSDMSHTGRGKSKSDGMTDIILAQIPLEQYRAETIERLRGVQNTVDKALEIATLRFDQNAAKLEGLEAMAAELPDGTKVAQDKNGNLRTLDGVLVDPELAAQVEIGPHNPSFESINEQRKRTDQSQNVLMQIRQDELTLGEYVEEIQNGNLSRERVDEINEKINDIENRADAALIPDHATTVRAVHTERQSYEPEALKL